MLRGFIRNMGAGMDLAKQRAALAAAGLDVHDEFAPVYLDDRDAAISSLLSGDVLAVATASCLGHPEHDILDALSEIGKRGASVLDLETGDEVKIHPSATMAMEFAIRGGTETRQAVAAKARKARSATGNFGGKQAVDWNGTKLKRLRDMLSEGMAREAMAKEFGISRATLQRKIRELAS